MSLLFSGFKKHIFCTSLLLLLSAWGSFASASVVPVCTGAGGCTPDISIAGGASADFVTNGSGGTLTIVGSTANGLFRTEDVTDSAGLAYSVSEEQSAGFMQFAIQGANAFELIMVLNGAGNIISGTIELGGRVVDIVGHGGFASTVRLFDGVTLLGPPNPAAPITNLLIESTSLSGATGGVDFNSSNNRIDLGFVGAAINPTSLLAPLGSGVAALGQITLAAGVTSVNYLTSSWSSSVNSLDVVVPIPATGILFFSAVVGLLGARRSQCSKVIF